MLFGPSNTNANNESEELTLESMALIMEAAILDNTSDEELQAFLENHTEVNAALRDEVLLEKTIVRLDKKAKLSQAQKSAVFVVAKEKNDIMMKKLINVWRMERYLEAQLMKKYGNEGMRRAKKAVSRSANSHSALVKKVAKKVNGQLGGK